MSDKCKGCGMGELVTRNRRGELLPVSKQYYNCLADIADECLCGAIPEDEFEIPVDTDLETLDHMDFEPIVTPWVEFLQEKGICYQDAVGNMPCDNGLVCDKCRAEWISDEYAEWLSKRGTVNE